MKLKLLLVILFCGFFGAGLVSAQQRQCAANDVLEKAIAKNPQLLYRMLEIEKQTAGFIQKTNSKKPDNPGNGNPGGGGGGGGGGNNPPPGFPKVTIPVIVHVVYNTASENVSDVQINSQIQVLTKDFTATNTDYNNYVPSEYQDVKGNANIEFCLVQTIRKSTSATSFGTNDAVKFSSSGGSDVVDPAHYLNIWVCDLSGGLLGYAQFPGGNPSTDGIVVDYQAFGTTGTATAPFHKGRTASHEVGHYLNLRHIWGDRRCGNDQVDDTPLHDGPNYGCPEEGATSNCKGPIVEMWMNIMDYTDDPCMYMFSGLQTARMRALLEPGAIRHDLVSGTCTAPSTRFLSTPDPESRSGNERNGNTINVFPTVTNGLVNYTINAVGQSRADMLVYNSNGALMMRESIMISEGMNNHVLDLGKFSSGIYFLHIRNEGRAYTEKLVLR